MNQTNSKKNNAKIYDLETLIKAGINPLTGLPLKLEGIEEGSFKPQNKQLLEIIDLQDALMRYEWFNLPEGLNGELIERVLYFKGQGAFFYLPDTKKFYFLPYALSDSIDCYGRFLEITPLPFNGTTKTDKSGKELPWVTGLTRECAYDIVLPEDNEGSFIEKKCVLLHDFPVGITQLNIPRQLLQNPLLDVMSDIIPFMHTALLNSTGVMGMRVGSEDEQSNVEAASRSITAAALQGRKYIPVTGDIQFQELTGGNVAKAEEFFLALQSLDNYRLSQYGIRNGGLFQKKAHMLEAEQQTNNAERSYALVAGLRERQDFCDIVNSIWGIGIDCAIRSDNDNYTTYPIPDNVSQSTSESMQNDQEEGFE